MKPRPRKLKLRTETLRNLSAAELARVQGGISSRVADACSTWGEDGGCIRTNASVCGTSVQYCTDTCPV